MHFKLSIFRFRRQLKSRDFREEAIITEELVKGILSSREGVKPIRIIPYIPEEALFAVSEGDGASSGFGLTRYTGAGRRALRGDVQAIGREKDGESERESIDRIARSARDGRRSTEQGIEGRFSGVGR